MLWDDEFVSDLRIVFVLSPYQNAFFFELADALIEALRTSGVDAIATTEGGAHQVGDGDVFVLLPPHEYVALEGSSLVDDPAVAARTVGITAEQPHQSFFERNASIGARLGGVLDFSPLAVAGYRRLGIDAEQLPFGYVPSWDARASRLPIEDASPQVLYLGNKMPRRLGVLASAADALISYDTRLVISDNSEPNRASSATFVVGDDKRRLLASTGLLLNIHQSEEPYFEWLRFIEAAHCATPVLTEASHDTSPFVAGEHFLEFDGGALGTALEAAWSDPGRLAEIGLAAHAAVVETPLVESIGVVTALAGRLLANRPPARLPPRTRTEPIGRLRRDPEAPRSDRPRRRSWLARPRSQPQRWTLVAPDGTELLAEPHELVGLGGGHPITNVMVAGLDEWGAPMLEGIWPWEPWRLVEGQHLGRVLVVETALHRAVTGWGPVAGFAHEYPHLAVQAYGVVHGLSGGHVARPLARSSAWPVDPLQRVPAECVDALRDAMTPAITRRRSVGASRRDVPGRGGG